jgi:hypothetical protein
MVGRRVKSPSGKALQARIGSEKCLLLHVSNKKANP